VNERISRRRLLNVAKAAAVTTTIGVGSGLASVYVPRFLEEQEKQQRYSEDKKRVVTVAHNVAQHVLTEPLQIFLNTDSTLFWSLSETDFYFRRATLIPQHPEIAKVKKVSIDGEFLAATKQNEETHAVQLYFADATGGVTEKYNPSKKPEGTKIVTLDLATLSVEPKLDPKDFPWVGHEQPTLYTLLSEKHRSLDQRIASMGKLQEITTEIVFPTATIQWLPFLEMTGMTGYLDVSPNYRLVISIRPQTYDKPQTTIEIDKVIIPPTSGRRSANFWSITYMDELESQVAVLPFLNNSRKERGQPPYPATEIYRRLATEAGLTFSD